VHLFPALGLGFGNLLPRLGVLLIQRLPGAVDALYPIRDAPIGICFGSIQVHSLQAKKIPLQLIANLSRFHLGIMVALLESVYRLDDLTEPFIAELIVLCFLPLEYGSKELFSFHFLIANRLKLRFHSGIPIAIGLDDCLRLYIDQLPLLGQAVPKLVVFDPLVFSKTLIFTQPSQPGVTF